MLDLYDICWMGYVWLFDVIFDGVFGVENVDCWDNKLLDDGFILVDW